MIKYISGVSNPRLIEECQTWGIGVLLTPDTAFRGAHYERIVSKYPFWAADNGCFNHPERSLDEFYSWLEMLPRRDALFVPAFDVVGNARQTLERSLPVLPEIRKRGFLAAFVAQNGIEGTVIPWDDLDALFIGGSTEFKLSEQSRLLVQEARERGKWTHMGRVNSYKRLKLANDWGCDSADGTYLRFTGPPGVDRIINWLRKIGGENENDLSLRGHQQVVGPRGEGLEGFSQDNAPW